MAEKADLILAVGTRLQDFTTGSWTAFARDARFVSVNTARWDATKHRAVGVVGDALETLTEIAALSDWSADPAWLETGKTEFATWNATLDEYQAGDERPCAHLRPGGGRGEPVGRRP